MYSFMVTECQICCETKTTEKNCRFGKRNKKYTIRLITSNQHEFQFTELIAQIFLLSSNSYQLQQSTLTQYQLIVCKGI